jgi:hypothetical protein
VAAVYCRACLALVPTPGDFCPKCGAADPAGRRAALFGAIFVAVLVGAVFAGAYAWMIGREWDRLDRKFDRLPPGHWLEGAATEAAVAGGGAVFLFGWLLAFALLRPRRP